MRDARRRLADYLSHIVEASDRIIQYTESLDEKSFSSSIMVQDAVIRNLEIIGEASKNILKFFPDFAEKHPDFPFSAAYQMRNVLSHGYFNVDLLIVWNTVQKDIPFIRSYILSVIDDLDNF